MPIKQIPYGRQNISRQDIQAVADVLRSDFLTQGPKVSEFEKTLARFVGVKYAVVVSSGTAALHLAYSAAGLSIGDEVIVTPNTFASVVNMLLVLGAKPVFGDIRLDSYNLDETKIGRLITKKTKAIVPLHFAGQACEMTEIRRLAREHKLVVIEDACHGLGSKCQEKKIGSLADLSVFNFLPVKPITSGEGGAILTNNQKYYKKLLHLRNHGIVKNKQGRNVMTELGYNYRLTDLQAALGLSQLKKLDWFIKKRRQVVKWYRSGLKGIKGIILPTEVKGNYSGWHIYVIRTIKAQLRDKLAAYLKQRGIGVNFHYPAVYSHPYYRANGFKKLKLANMERYQSSCLTLPCYPTLKRTEVAYIAQIIRKFFKEK